jgi:excisionase family DNA binding protein
MEDRWLSVDEIGEYLGVTRETIYAWLSKKGLPGHRVGRLWKFKRTEIDEWVRTGDSTNRSASENGDEAKQKA